MKILPIEHFTFKGEKIAIFELYRLYSGVSRENFIKESEQNFYFWVLFLPKNVFFIAQLVTVVTVTDQKVTIVICPKMTNVSVTL